MTKSRKQNKNERKIYLDYAATTPVDPRVKEEMVQFFSEKFGNASQLYSFGQEAKEALEQSREQIQSLIKAKDPDEIIFNSGGTEADNTALKGIMLARWNKKNHLITSKIEHAAILNTCKYLQKKGIKVTYLPVNEDGLVEPEELKRNITPETALVSIMHANNEIGTIEPIKTLAEISHDYGALFHTDAVQTVGKIPVNVQKLGIDMLSMSSHKIYGPKGIGALYKRKDVRLTPLIHGGGHEKGIRSGTENVAGAVGFGKAAEIAQKELHEERKRLEQLRNKLISNILTIPETKLNGHRKKRLPHNANFIFKYIEGEALILRLDDKGIFASTGSACSTQSLRASHVLLAIGLRPEIAHGSLRLTLGRWTTENEIDYVLDVLPNVVKDLRKLSAFTKETEAKVRNLKHKH
ncbi:MAG: cysteine desulfurase NifS [Asgard group archaeon]|nr:cysteine desulfurase NifS [Asgard group archaeon]